MDYPGGEVLMTETNKKRVLFSSKNLMFLAMATIIILAFYFFF